MDTNFEKLSKKSAARASDVSMFAVVDKVE
jgi:hypothetical protein